MNTIKTASKQHGENSITTHVFEPSNIAGFGVGPDHTHERKCLPLEDLDAASLGSLRVPKCLLTAGTIYKEPHLRNVCNGRELRNAEVKKNFKN